MTTRYGIFFNEYSKESEEEIVNVLDNYRNFWNLRSDFGKPRTDILYFETYNGLDADNILISIQENLKHKGIEEKILATISVERGDDYEYEINKEHVMLHAINSIDGKYIEEEDDYDFVPIREEINPPRLLNGEPFYSPYSEDIYSKDYIFDRCIELITGCEFDIEISLNVFDEKAFKLVDQLGANWGDIESESFDSLGEIIDRLGDPSHYLQDYFGVGDPDEGDSFWESFISNETVLNVMDLFDCDYYLSKYPELELEQQVDDDSQTI